MIFPTDTNNNYQKLTEAKQLANEYGFECPFLNYGHSGQPGDYDKVSSFNWIFMHSVDLKKRVGTGAETTDVVRSDTSERGAASIDRQTL
jgi:hypothetical protein